MKCDSGLPEPDLVFFLNLSVCDAEKRGGYGKERYENKEFQEQVHKNFLELKTQQWKVFIVFFFGKRNETQVSF